MHTKEKTPRAKKTSAQQPSPSRPAKTLHAPARQPTHPATILQRTRFDPGALTPGDVMRLQRTVGNQAVGRHLQRAGAGQARPAARSIIQRSPLSDELEKASKAKTTQEIFTLLGQTKFRDGAKDPAEQTALHTVIDKVVARPNDRWVAKTILAGQLGLSAAIPAKGQPGLSADIPAQPIEAHFFAGASQERALVVAGVHGSERQGIEVARMLIDNVLKKATPHYSVIVVPSLFPAHAHKNWGVEGKRERSTFTNRNFPDLNAEVAGYKGGAAVDAAGNPIMAAKDEKGRVQPILPENVMLMELIDRFQPSRIISIHGTHAPASAGVFADPHFLSPAKEKAIDFMAFMLSSMAGPLGFLAHAAIKAQLLDAAKKVDEARTQNDIDLALATAYAIAAKTAGAAELKKRFTGKKQKDFPSVAGNKLYEGKGKESATWREDYDPVTKGPKPWQERTKDKGVSLGLYGPAKGVSVFTVEPPVNRALDFYDGKNAEPKGAKVSKAQRQIELESYAEAVATILLGPDAGAAALAKQRP
jgi:hypothetical protein